MRILQVNSADAGGGAENVAWNLARAYQARGHDSWLAVGHPKTHAAHVLRIPNDDCRGAWARACLRLGDAGAKQAERSRSVRALRHLLADWAGQPGRRLRICRGHEDFAFPGSWRLLDLPPAPPEILHAHNLHGGYFDLRALSWLSERVPVVLTLHDAWLLSGHCAHSLGCGKWQTGCGQCPHLETYPAVPRDATAQNWRRKQQILGRGRFYVAAPSRWLMEKAARSMLAPSLVEARVIPNGVDRSVFRPADRRAARSSLGLPLDACVLLFTAASLRTNPYKDYDTIRRAVARAAGQMPGSRVLFLGLGDGPRTEQIGDAEARFVPYQDDPVGVARYYQAADVYLHAARADTFPTTVLEALACGTPVVATAVGGIPEQIREGRTGFCVPPGDAEAMAARVVSLVRDPELRSRLGTGAASDAARRFDLEQQVDAYLAWYREILAVEAPDALVPSGRQHGNQDRDHWAR